MMDLMIKNNNHIGSLKKKIDRRCLKKSFDKVKRKRRNRECNLEAKRGLFAIKRI